MTDVCPFAVWKPISANHTTGGRQAIRGFVPHVQVGYGSLFGFFNTPKAPGAGASADFWCSQSGELEQYVSLVDQSWAQGSKQFNGNPYMVSCEFEGQPDEPMTPQQIAMGGRLIAWLLQEHPFALVYNTIPGDEGITPHHVFGGGHTCPGPGPREAQFPDLIAAAQGEAHMPLDTLDKAYLESMVQGKIETVLKEFGFDADSGQKLRDLDAGNLASAVAAKLPGVSAQQVEDAVKAALREGVG